MYFIQSVEKYTDDRHRDWHRFARAEYARMAMEEEGQSDGAMEIDSMDGWYVSEDEADEDHDDFSHGARTTAEAPF